MALWTLSNVTQHDHRAMLTDLVKQVEKVCVLDMMDAQPTELCPIATDRGVHERDAGLTPSGLDARLYPTPSATRSLY